MADDAPPGYGARQLDGHRRRRAAALKLPPLPNGRRDPLSYREIADCVERREPNDTAPSAKMADAGLQAAEHLLAAGLTPIVHMPTLRVLYRRGGDDRQIAELLARLSGAA